MAQVANVVANAAGNVTEWERKQYQRMLAEKIRRECESLRLYEPLPFQMAFHKCRNQQALIMKGNRVGGTVALCVEIARAVTGQDPEKKYPLKDGRAVVLGYGEKHIGRVFYDKLFRPGVFRVLRDRETGMWRAWRPWLEDDKAREAETKPAPPLIPNRFIDGKIAWEKRSERVFSVVRFTNGWELHATNSAGDPGQAQGFSVNLYAMDEDLATTGWYEEAIGRIADCGGLLRWSALPHAKNNDLMQLIDLAEKEQEKANPTAVVFRASIFDNRYLPKDSVEKSVIAWKAQGEDIYRKRAMGEISISSTLMYPTFNRRVHDVMKVTETSSPAQKILAERMGEPPDDWTRYVTIDPGYNICAIEFLAVPPPELGNQIFLYDECYLHEATANTFGDAMARKCSDYVFEAFILDMHGGRLRSIGGGELPVDKYRDALRERGVKALSTGHSFRHACDDRKRREEDMRTLLGIQRNGQPRLMVVVGKCSSFCGEMERFRKKTVKQWGKEVTIDEGDRRVNTHAIEAVEGAISLELPYIKPRKISVAASLVRAWKDRQERRKAKSRHLGGNPYISLGPSGAQ